MSLDYDLGELLVFQENTSTLLFPVRGSHRFQRFPPPPSRWPSRSNNNNPQQQQQQHTQYASLTTNSNSSSIAMISPSTLPYSALSSSQQQQQQQQQQQRATYGTSGNKRVSPTSWEPPATNRGHFPANAPVNSPPTPGAAGVNNTLGLATTDGISSLLPHQQQQREEEEGDGGDVHWTFVSEGAFQVAPEVAAQPSSTPRHSTIGGDENQHGNAAAAAAAAASAASSFASPTAAAKFATSVVVSLTAAQQRQLYAQQQQQDAMREAVAGVAASVARRDSNISKYSSGGGQKQQFSSGFDDFSFTYSSPSLSPSSSSASAPTTLTVGDKTLLVISVGCPTYRVDVALVLWYSNSDKGVKPGFWFHQSEYLLDFVKHAAHELGFLPLSPLSPLVTASMLPMSLISAAASAAAAIGSPLNIQHQQQLLASVPGSSASLQFAAPLSSSPSYLASSHVGSSSSSSSATAAAAAFSSSERPLDLFLCARASLRERVRQLRLALVPNINAHVSSAVHAHAAGVIGTFYYPITMPRSVGKTDREMHLAVQIDETLRYSWEAQKSLTFLCNPSDRAVMNFACSAIAYAVALSRNSALFGTRSAQSSGGVIFPDLVNFQLPPSNASSPTNNNNNNNNKTPVKNKNNNNNNNNNTVSDPTGSNNETREDEASSSQQQQQQQQQRTLTELLALAIHHDLENSDCSAQQKSLVKIEQLVACICYLHQHPGSGRVVILSQRKEVSTTTGTGNSNNSSEDFVASCIFDVLRAVFRPGGRFAHSKDSGLFARKVAERDGAKPGQLWGAAAFWTPITHIELNPATTSSASASARGDAAHYSAAASAHHRDRQQPLLVAQSSQQRMHYSSSPSSPVTDGAFFVSRLQSACEFGHTLLVIDCINKQVFIAAPTQQVSNHNNSNCTATAAIGGAAELNSNGSTMSTAGSVLQLPPPILAGAGAGGTTQSSIGHTINIGAGGTVSHQQRKQLQQQQQQVTKCCHLSALPCAVTFVEECRTMWESAHASQQLQPQQPQKQFGASSGGGGGGAINSKDGKEYGNISSSGAKLNSAAVAAAVSARGGGGALGAAYGAASSVNVDMLRSLVDLGPVLRSIAECEMTQLLLNGSGNGGRGKEEKDPFYHREGSSSASSAAGAASPFLTTPPRVQQQQQQEFVAGNSLSQAQQQILSMNGSQYFGGGNSLSPMRTRSNLSIVNFLASSPQPQNNTSSGHYGNVASAGNSFNNNNAGRSQLGSLAEQPPSSANRAGGISGAAGGLISSVSGTNNNASVAQPAVKGAIKAQSSLQPAYSPGALMNSFLCNDVFFALLL